MFIVFQTGVAGGCRVIIVPCLDKDLFENKGVGPDVYNVLERLYERGQLEGRRGHIQSMLYIYIYIYIESYML